MAAPSRSLVAVLATTLASLLLAAPAGAEFVASGADRSGDAASPDPARDIVAAAFSYDRATGTIKGGVRLRAAPGRETAARFTLYAGTRTATGCNGYPAVGFSTRTDERTVGWARLDGPGNVGAAGRASKTYDEAIEEYEARSPSMAGRRPDCVIAQLSEPEGGPEVYDVAGPYVLRGVPEIEATMGAVPSRMRAGRARTVRVTLRNRGDAETGRVRVAVKSVRGLRARTASRVASIRPGGRRTVSVRVTLTSRARSSTALRVTATGADRVRGEAEGRLVLSRPSSSGGSGGSGSGSKLCYRYDWQPPYGKLVPC